MCCLFRWLLRLAGFGGREDGCDSDPAERQRRQARRRRFREKMREAFAVWREDEDTPAAAPAEAAPAERPVDPLED